MAIGDELAALEERVNLRLAAELAAIRTEIANTRASVEEKLRVQTWTIVTTMIALAGLVSTITFTIARFT
jgi:hypothetical protein